MTHTTIYRDTLVTVSADCPVAMGVVPGKPGAIATLQYALLAEPYRLTSDDLLFEVHRARGGEKTRDEFFARPQACLRASPLVKQFGWGLHHDSEGRVAAVAVDGADYAKLLADPAVKKTPGMRSRRA